MSKLSEAIANAIIDYVDNHLTIDELYVQLERDIDTAKVKVWREDKSIPLPTYGKKGDACCDVYCKYVEYDDEKDRYIVHTGLHFALPKGYEMELRPRSSNTKTEFYCPNSPMTLDEGYRGELLVIFKDRTSAQVVDNIDYLTDMCAYIATADDPEKYNPVSRNEVIELKDSGSFPYKENDRICQLLIRHREQIEWDEVESLEELGTTERGTGGFGHTGR